MYKIRFHGRGGQGVKTASRMLGTAFFLEGFEVQDAPRYGAERRGAPIFAYVRAAANPIYERGILPQPDLIIVVDESLMALPAAGVTLGESGDSVMVVAGDHHPEVWRRRLNLESVFVPLPGAPTEGARPLVGTYCAGAAAGLVGAIEREHLAEAVRIELDHLPDEVIERNVKVGLAGFDSVQHLAGAVQESPDVALAMGDSHNAWVDLPVDGALDASSCIDAGPTSVANMTGLWRTTRPEHDPHRCKQCWWLCATFCPDNSIAVDPAGMPSIDYDHCKGCLVCVAQCPHHAIEAVPETMARTGGAA